LTFRVNLIDYLIMSYASIKNLSILLASISEVQATQAPEAMLSGGQWDDEKSVDIEYAGIVVRKRSDTKYVEIFRGNREDCTQVRQIICGYLRGVKDAKRIAVSSKINPLDMESPLSLEDKAKNCTELTISDNDGPEGYFKRMRFETAEQAAQYVLEAIRFNPHETFNYRIVTHLN
jgi:hypothetical protein